MRIPTVVCALLGFATCSTSSAPPSTEPVAAADPAAGEEAPEAAEETADAAEDVEAADAGDEASEPAEGADDGADGGDAEGADAEAGDDGDEGEGEGEGEPEDEGSAEGQPSAEMTPLELPPAINTRIRSTCGKDKGVGTKLKPFKLANTKGKSYGNRSYGNRVLLVNFWGTWCKPCLKELPEFERLYRRYRKHGLVVVAIATDDDPEPVQAYIDKRKLRSRVLIGGEDYAGKYGAPTFPFTYVVDGRGVIRAAYHGYKPECMGKLEADIREELVKRHERKQRAKK